ncbi:MAG TPA: cytochrome c [Flavisolibacter sp.]|nr:cytochrome c [Flavisolibacter sp.]
MRLSVYAAVLAGCFVASTAMGQTKAPAKKTTSASSATSKSSVAAGKEVYMKYCVSCHQPDGGGVQNMNPPLIKTSYVLGSKQKLITIILNGLSRQEIEGETYTNVMAPFASQLTDQQIADVLTYIRKSFGNKASAVTPSEVKVTRAKGK